MYWEQRHHFADKGPYSQIYGFSSSHIRLWDLDHKESWVLKNDALKLWCWRRLLRGLLDCKELKPVKPKGNQPWIFIGRTDGEAEAPKLCPPDAKSWLTEKTLSLWNIEGRRRRVWQRIKWLNSITDSLDMNFSKLGDSGGRRSLVCYRARGHKESDMTQRLNNSTTTTIKCKMYTVKYIYSSMNFYIYTHPRDNQPH